MRYYLYILKQQLLRRRAGVSEILKRVAWTEWTKKWEIEKEALKWLALLRGYTPLYDQCLALILHHTRKGEISFEQIGTSAEELERLRLENARSSIRYLREHQDEDHIDSFCREAYVRSIFSQVRKRRLTWRALGITMDELQELGNNTFTFRLIR